MSQTEILYPYGSVTIAVTLFFLMLLGNESGFRLGLYVRRHTDSELKALTGSIQASVLGLLALMLGFTFNMAMQRYNDRSMGLIEEVNALGILELRTELLPPPSAEDTRDVLRQYVELRVKMGGVALTDYALRAEDNMQVARLQQELWTLTVAAMELDPRPITTGAFAQSLTAAIEAQGKRNGLQEMHVPEMVLLLLFVVFIASGGMIGYSADLSGKRMVAPVVLVSLLVTLIVFIIIDLDRPKRGLIRVNEAPLLELQDRLRN